jgi:hypothetical protein
MLFSLSVGRAMRSRNLQAKSGKRAQGAALLAAIAATPAMGTIYYVSPTGSDSNTGTNPSAPWGTVSKVDNTTFQPGDEILFQYGSTWDATLNATSSGTTSAPIVYGAYGNPTQGNPTFMGSNPISAAAFTQVSGTTYETSYATPVNWVFNNNQYDHESEDALRSQSSSNVYDPATNLSYVENNPNSFYYNASSGQLYVNVGASLTGQNLAVATRQYAIQSFGQSNLVFQNLNASQTAADGGGYGVHIENSTNIHVLNSTVSLAGVHSFGITDTVGFVGTNLVANGSQPDLGYGGASAAATYGDADGAVATGTNNTSVWTNLTYLNPNGAYPVFISHGNANGVASVAINNVNASGYAAGVIIYSTSSTETALINGGHLDDGASEVDTNNSVVNGLTISGAYGSISLGGTGSTIQNSTFIGNAPNPEAGHTGIVTDNGTNNTIRFNTFDNAAYTGPEVGVTNPASNTTIVGNIMSPTGGPTIPVWTLFSGNPTLQSDYNLLQTGNSYQLGSVYNHQQLSPAQWQAMGYDLSSATGNPIYTNLADGIYMLQSNSPGIGLYTASINPNLTVANTLLGSPNYNGSYNAGLNPNVWPNMNVLPSTLFLNNGLTNSIVPAVNTLNITSTGGIVSGSTSTLNLVGNVNNSGNLLVLGGLITTGNFTNAGTIVVNGSQVWVPGMTFTNTAGTATFETDTGGPYGPSQSLAFNVTGGTVIFASTQHLL